MAVPEIIAISLQRIAPQFTELKVKFAISVVIIKLSIDYNDRF